MLSRMARPSFTLAALATAALPGLEVATARVRTTGASGDFDAAEVFSTDSQHLIIRVPRTQVAEADQSADLVALRALTEGVRQRLPFEVPLYLGQAPIGPTRGILYEFIAGTQLSSTALTEDPSLAASVGRAIAAIHNLPISVVTDAGLPNQAASQIRTDAVELINQAAATGHLPAALRHRWTEAADDDALWQFAPTVINGELAPDSFLVLENRVNGLLDWASLAVGDPARDVHWLRSARGEYAELALSSYIAARGGLADPTLARRALLYSELELARWLLHGFATSDAGVIDDAVTLLDALVANVHADSAATISDETGPILTVQEVESILEHTPLIDPVEASPSLMTDSYDRSEFELAAAGEVRTVPADETAEEPLDGVDPDAAGVAQDNDEPVAMDRSLSEGVPEWEPGQSDEVSTEPLNLPCPAAAPDANTSFQADRNSSSS